MRRLGRVKRSLRAVQLLKREKREKTYKKLSGETGLPITVLNRYVKGRVLPNQEKSGMIISLYGGRLKEEAKSKILKFGRFINDIDLLTDVKLLSSIAKAVAGDYEKVELVVTTEDGLPVATLLAKEIGARIGYLRERKKLGVKDYIEINIFDEKGTARPLYLPAEVCSSSTKTLFVDDVIRTGRSAEAILTVLSEQSRLQGCFALVAIGGAGKKRVEGLCPTKTFVEFKEDG